MLATFSRKLWPRADSDTTSAFCICEYICNDEEALSPEGLPMDGETFVAKGNSLPTLTAIQVQLNGTWVKDKNGRYAFSVKTFTEKIPQNEKGICAYLVYIGMSLKAARALFATYGSSTIEKLDEDPMVAMEAASIRKDKAMKYLAAYVEKRGAKDVIMTLVPLGVKEEKCKRIYASLKGAATKLLSSAPFELCSEVKLGEDRISYHVAEQVADKNGLPQNAGDRIRAALVETLNQAANGGHLFKGATGHTCLPYGFWLQKTVELLGGIVTAEQLQGYVKEISDSGDVQFFCNKELVDMNGNNPWYAYSTQIWNAEKIAAENLARLANTAVPAVFDIEDEIRQMEQRVGYKLAPEQMNAVYTALKCGISVISGGPGTGKTTISDFIRSIYAKKYPKNKILLCAPTGAAAVRMSEATGAEASTIHRSLEIRGGDDVLKGVSNGMLDYDLIMVDEMSMTDAFLFAALLKAAKNGTKFCLIGDADQLPSVGAGDVLAQIIEARSEHIGVVKLNKVYRQKDGSLPALNAFLIKNGKDSLDYGETFQFIQANTFEEAAEEMKDIYRREVAIEGIDNVMMVTPNNRKTASGVKALNEIRDEINPAKSGKAEYAIGKRVFREGDKVVQLKNIMKDGVSISNGDIGYISTIESGNGKTKVIVSFSMNRVAEYEPFELEDLDLAYATTIHKSQGNQARVVILDILDAHSIMLRRNLLYTAITRAEERVYIVGQKSAISKAISIGVRDEDKRITNLASLIRQSF